MLFDVFQQYPAAMPILATVGGLIIGSFLNVVIWRYPIMLRQQMAEFHGETPSTQSKISLALPRSHCPHCQQTIRVRDNIPLLSWLMLKGRCRDCQAKISKRYPLVELLTALAFLLASLVWPRRFRRHAAGPLGPVGRGDRGSTSRYRSRRSCEAVGWHREARCL